MQVILAISNYQNDESLHTVNFLSFLQAGNPCIVNWQYFVIFAERFELLALKKGRSIFESFGSFP